MKIVLIIFALLSFASFSQKNLNIQLDSGWTFSSVQNEKWYPAMVPGLNHIDLLRNELISNPYFENNEKEQVWIEKEDWQYKRTIVADKKLLSKKHIELVCKGLDTYASISINGKILKETNNMFREWVIDLKPHLKAGENELLILFKSPINVNREKVLNAKYELPSGNETVDLKVSSYTRKAAYQFGWDFSPRFITSGIWREIYLRTWDNLRMENVNVVTQSIEEDKAILNFSFEIYSDDENRTDYQLYYDNHSIQLFLKPGLNTINEIVEVNNPKLWYPNGYGEPYMYLSRFDLKNNEQVFESNFFRYAIRKVELIQEDDSIGTSFYFKVNDIPVFVKGANYVPQDIFLTEVDGMRYNKLIKQVKDANMNMLRVWGGGIYENDYFYQLCDFNGIMIWQDFMFANSMYPNDLEFLDNVEQEIRYNIKRLRLHPCIVLWCGNNEIEVAWENWGWQEKFKYTEEESKEIWANYQLIFNKVIPENLKHFDSTRAYISSSPQSNWGTKENFNKSSMHYWGVWHGKEEIEEFENNVGRFMVEYGFQSFPVHQLLHEYILDSNLNLSSETIKNRQKSYIGNDLIDKNITKYFGSVSNFKAWCFHSQKVQSIALEIAIRSHRLSAPHCMGTLIWQLNDCWPGPSWSLIDYKGNPKEAYRMVSDKFKSLTAFAYKKDNKFIIDVVSDLQNPFKGSVKILYRHQGGEVLEETNQFFEIKHLDNQRILEIPLNELDIKYGLENLSAFIRVYKRDSGKRVYRERFLF